MARVIKNVGFVLCSQSDADLYMKKDKKNNGDLYLEVLISVFWRYTLYRRRCIWADKYAGTVFQTEGRVPWITG